ncbi:non-specific lipid transfer protein GPI-anchored 14-like [Andrographis paniculata]|uniref:non-specific lipid transfer protein GPI-anchored 14-like n=1 Tax=Andrographis paniculata TaxID=175694 RepID=UPI0021E6F5FC|nr:non-specific lipid transfer protein GPI-anchored 14-like [Andrographis paniculata]
MQSSSSSKSPMLQQLLLLLLLQLSSSSSDADADAAECGKSLSGLAPCLPYVQGQRTAKSPTPDCCAALEQLLRTTTTKKCLCVIIKDRNDPDFAALKVNASLAISLPRACSHVPAPSPTNCPALLGLPPNSPEAQIFYQLANNNNTRAPGVPTPTPTPTHTGAAVGIPPAPDAGAQKSGGGGRAGTSFHIMLHLLLSAHLYYLS